MTIEVVISDDIGSTSVEANNALTGVEAVIEVATGYVVKSIRDGFSFEGYTLDFEKPEVGARVRLRFYNFESNDGLSDAKYFESII